MLYIVITPDHSRHLVVVQRDVTSGLAKESTSSHYANEFAIYCFHKETLNGLNISSCEKDLPLFWKIPSRRLP